MTRPEQVAEQIKALAEVTRLRILALLADHGTLCVCELEQVMGLPQPTVSRHLATLRKVGLVSRERDGARVDYHLARTLDDFQSALLAAALAELRDDPVFRADRTAAASIRPACCAGPA